MARLSRRLWGGTSLKTAAKEATFSSVTVDLEIQKKDTFSPVGDFTPYWFH